MAPSKTWLLVFCPLFAVFLLASAEVSTRKNEENKVGTRVEESKYPGNGGQPRTYVGGGSQGNGGQPRTYVGGGSQGNGGQPRTYVGGGSPGGDGGSPGGSGRSSIYFRGGSSGGGRPGTYGSGGYPAGGYCQYGCCGGYVNGECYGCCSH